MTLLNPNLSTGFSGLDYYRGWVSATLDGVPFFCNGFDSNWRWEVGSATKYPMGSTAPTTFAVADSGGGTTFPLGTVLFYYLEFYNSTLGKATCPQLTGVAYGVSHTMVATRDAAITWTDPGGEWDKVRIWRRLQNSDNFRLVATVTASTATYTDSTPDAMLEGNGTVYVPRYRSTLPPVFDGIVDFQGRLWGWTGTDALGYYAQETLIGAEFVSDDFPDANIFPFGVNDGMGYLKAMVPYNDSLLAFKERGAYELRGADVLTWDCQVLYADRGCISQRCIVAQEGWLYVLDTEGVYRWRPGMTPETVGATTNTDASPLQPIFDRMNIGAAKKFHAIVDRAQRVILFHIALDYEPFPNVRLRYDYGTNRWIGVDTLVHAGASGVLLDTAGLRHTCRTDDMGFLWEENYGTSEGVQAGDTSGTVTSWSSSTLTMTLSAAAFSTSETSGPTGTPYRRRTGTTVVESNRPYTNGATAITPYLLPLTTPAANDTVKVGTVPFKVRTPKMRFGTTKKKHARTVAFEFNRETTGTLAVSGARDDESEASLSTPSLTGGVRAIVPINSRFRTYQLTLEQDDASAAVTLRSAAWYVYEIEDRRT